MRLRDSTLIAGLTLSMAGADATAADFNAVLSPEFNVVDVDSLVEISFDVDETALQFNGYEVTVAYDPTVVSFDSVIEGPLMVNSCANRFTNLATTDTTVTFSNVLLCADLSIDGPGTLCIFRFLAVSDGTTSIDIVSDPDRTFTDNGLFVWPQHPTFPRQVVFLHGAEIQVGDVVEVFDAPGSAVAPLHVSLARNPIRTGTFFNYELRQASARVAVDVVDVRGRRVARLDLGPHPAGAFSRYLPARDRRGRALSAGTYFYRLRTDRDAVGGRFQIVR